MYTSNLWIYIYLPCAKALSNCYSVTFDSIHGFTIAHISPSSSMSYSGESCQWYSGTDWKIIWRHSHLFLWWKLYTGGKSHSNLWRWWNVEWQSSYMPHEWYKDYVTLNIAPLLCLWPSDHSVFSTSIVPVLQQNYTMYMSPYSL